MHFFVVELNMRLCFFIRLLLKFASLVQSRICHHPRANRHAPPHFSQILDGRLHAHDQQLLRHIGQLDRPRHGHLHGAQCDHAQRPGALMRAARRVNRFLIRCRADASIGRHRHRHRLRDSRRRRWGAVLTSGRSAAVAVRPMAERLDAHLAAGGGASDQRHRNTSSTPPSSSKWFQSHRQHHRTPPALRPQPPTRTTTTTTTTTSASHWTCCRRLASEQPRRRRVYVNNI